MRKLLGLIVFLTIAAPVCIEVSSAGECENPETITFSIVPDDKTAEALKLYQPLIDHLENVTGKKVDFYMPTSRASVMEALIHRWVDVAQLGPASYVIAREKSNREVEVFTTYELQKGITQPAATAYHAILITRKGSGLKTAEDLKGKVLALVEPASTSGALVPEVFFPRDRLDGMPLKEYFGRIFYSGAHDLSALAIKEGRADCAFVATQNFDRTIWRGQVKLEDFNIVWWSPPLPMDPTVYRKSLCPKLKNKIEEAFFTLHTNEAAEPFLKKIKAARYVPIDDRAYDGVRELQATRKKRKP